MFKHFSQMNPLSKALQRLRLTCCCPGFRISLGMMNLGPVSPAKPHLQRQRTESYLWLFNNIYSKINAISNLFSGSYSHILQFKKAGFMQEGWITFKTFKDIFKTLSKHFKTSLALQVLLQLLRLCIRAIVGKKEKKKWSRGGGENLRENTEFTRLKDVN